MKVFETVSRVLLTASVLCMTGCGGQQIAPGAPGISPLMAQREAELSKDWVFVSDPGTAEVYIYSISKLELVEIVTGFKQPEGECSDLKGDVYVTDGSGQTIYELEHSGKTLQSLSDPNGYPDGCAWDAKTGNLAVFNAIGTNSGSGAVLIYHHGRGTPNAYYNPKQFYYDFGGYDTAGNLFFDGRTAGNAFVLSELPVNAPQAKTVSIKGGEIHTPGMVQWAANELVVGDQNCGNKGVSCLYELTVANYHATVHSQTQLSTPSGGQVCDLIQGIIWNKRLIGSDFDSCDTASSATYVWPYPSGGAPTGHARQKESQPYGAAISIPAAEDRR